MESTGSTRSSRPPARAGDLVEPALDDPHQASADADEHHTVERYERHREFVAVVGEAVRRAEALMRLERALALQPR